MSKFLWIFVGMVLAVFLYAAARIGTTSASAAPPTPPPGPHCIKEKRQHAYGSYQYHISGPGGHSWGDAPIDLTITECLEWEVLK